MSERILPHSVEAESHVLSCCILDGNETIAKCLNAKVGAAHFFTAPNQTLWGVITHLYEKCPPVTEETVIQELMSRKLLEAIGGMEYLLRIQQHTPTTAHVDYFIQKLVINHVLRGMIRVSQSIVERCHEFMDDDLEQLTKLAESDLMAVTQQRIIAPRTWEDACRDAVTHFDKAMSTLPGQATGEVSWGFVDLDRCFEPMQPNQLCILAARPSVGKSSLMRQIIAREAGRGNACFVASLEVKDHVIVRHLAQQTTGIPFHRLRHSRNASDIADFKSALEEAKKLPIYAIDDFGATASQICAHARLIHARDPLSIVCVDYLQELTDAHGDKHQTTTEAIGAITRQFKSLAGELGIVVLLLSQLNRASERDNRHPVLADLRASGDIEQAADKVVMLHRPSENPNTGMEQSSVSNVSDVPRFYLDVSQMKGRDDGTAHVGMMFERETTRFIQIT